MGKLTITVDLDSADMEYPAAAVKAIKSKVSDLTLLGKWPEDHNFDISIYDANGNRVGNIAYDRFA